MEGGITKQSRPPASFMQAVASNHIALQGDTCRRIHGGVAGWGFSRHSIGTLEQMSLIPGNEVHGLPLLGLPRTGSLSSAPEVSMVGGTSAPLTNLLPYSYISHLAASHFVGPTAGVFSVRGCALTSPAPPAVADLQGGLVRLAGNVLPTPSSCIDTSQQCWP